MKRWIAAITTIVIFSWLIVLTIFVFNYRNRTFDQMQILANQKLQDPNTELLTLKAQLQLISEYNDDFLSTVHWSIAFASTFLLAFLGLAGYLSNRRYEQDKEAMQLMLVSKTVEVRAELATEIDKSKASLQAEYQSLAKELKSSLQEIARSASVSAVSSVRTQVNQLTTDFLLFKRDDLQAQAKEEETKKHWRTALSNYFEIAKIGKRINWEWIISGALKDIERVLENGGQFDPDDTREVNQFLRELPPEYEPLVKGVQTRL